MSNYLDVFVRDALKRVPGVADVLIFGERKYAMRLWLDPTRLASRGLTAADVTGALREQNVQVAAGAVGQPPVPSGQLYQISVRAAGRLSEPTEFENIIVKAGTDGTLIRLKDIGRAELGAETYSSALRFNGVEAVGFGVMQLPSANALDVYNDCVAELERLAKAFPPGMKYQIAFDTATVVQDSIREVVITLFEAIGLVVIVMFLFLQDWRSTIIPAATIPVSLVGVFAFVKLLGFSINTLTLFGIVLATGIVVDDAIVVIENIQRHISEYGRTARQAASEAMGEVLGAVIATALVLIAVFVPVAFFPGTTGRLYQQFSLTIAFSVALSAFNAVTLTPALSALLLKKEGKKGRFFRLVEAIIDRATHGYVAVVRRVVRQRVVMVLLFLLMLGATVWVYRTVPSAFLPDEDQGYFIILIQAPEGASLEYTSNIGKQIEQVLRPEKDIASAFTVGGFSFSGASPNRGLLFVRLKPYDERRNDEQSAQAIVTRLRGPLMGGISGAIALPFLPPPIRGLGAFGGFQFEVLDQTGGPIENLAAATQNLVQQGNRTTELRGLFTSFTTGDPQLYVDIDRQRVKALNMPLNEVTDALQVFLGSQYVNDFDFNNRAYRVYVQADQRFRNDPTSLAQFYARAGTGEMVPLSNLVHVKETTAPQVISHFNLFRSAEINGAAAPGYSSGQALGAMGDLASRTLPVGMTYAWAGQSLGGDQRRFAGRGDFRARPAARLPHLVGPIRKLPAAVHHPAGGSGGRARRRRRAGPARSGQRHLLPGRPRHADRPRRQERDPDRRVRRAAARARVVDCRRGRRGRAHPPPSDPDDVVCLHPWRVAAGHRAGRRRGRPPFRWHRGFRRHDRLDVPQPPVHPGAVRRRAHAGARRTARRRSAGRDGVGA